MNEPSLTQRLLALFSHLGVKRAHIATQMPGDIAGLAGEDPDRLGGVVLCVPTRLDPGSFVGVGDRMLAISGSSASILTTMFDSRKVSVGFFLSNGISASPRVYQCSSMRAR